MNLRSIFSSVVYKELAPVDLPARVSHQHELDGVAALREFFGGAQGMSGNIQWHFFADNADPVSGGGKYTFYDARAKTFARTGRSEWRMYYESEFLNHANPGDVLILARTEDENIFGLVFQNNSAWLRAARTLFGMEAIQPRLQLMPEAILNEQELEFFRQQILEELGIEFKVPTSAQDEELANAELERARDEGRNFPSTQRMASLAQSLIQVDINNGDETLIRWLTREEQIFRAIERILVQRKLDEGFESVDEFISYSLSIQNRRKARMGIALQNHLARLFTARNLRYETQKRTEGKNTPDFLFPGRAEYLDQAFATNLLVMLGAKSSCKERWRQILTEADRIGNKHLCTLEQAISVDQTDEMRTQHVTLVLPESFHSSYTPGQRGEIWTVNQFIDFVRAKQTV